MTDIVKNIQSEVKKNYVDSNSESDHMEDEIETTSASEMENFNIWARGQALKDLKDFKQSIDLCDITSLRTKMSSLKFEQRRLFDDIMERIISNDVNERPVHLFVSGNAGTGKSYLVRLLIEAIKIVSVNLVLIC